MRFGNRVAAYVALMRDEYPSTDEEQAVHLALPYPDAERLERWLPLVKWFLAIPHYIVLFFLSIGASSPLSSPGSRSSSPAATRAGSSTSSRAFRWETASPPTPSRS